MKVAAIQIEAALSPEEALRQARNLVSTAAEDGAQLVLLPEFFSVPFVQPEYDPEYYQYAEPLDGSSNNMVSSLSKEYDITIVSSIFEATRTPGVYHNTACTFVSGEMRNVYRKAHLPYSNGFPEKAYFQPGRRPPEVVDTPVGTIGTIICYERHYPELSRLVALKGALVLCIPVASSSAPMKSVFEIEMQGHAVANQMPVLTANRVGQEGVKDYFGGTAVYGPAGETLAEVGDGPGVALATLDLSEVEVSRRARPFLRDRRPELYADLA